MNSCLYNLVKVSLGFIAGQFLIDYIIDLRPTLLINLIQWLFFILFYSTIDLIYRKMKENKKEKELSIEKFAKDWKEIVDEFR